MTEVFQELIESGFRLLLVAAVVAAPVALLAFIVDFLAGGRMAARFRCWLWVVVAVRLLMPLAPDSVASLQNVWSLLDHTSANQTSAELATLDTSSLDWEDVSSGSPALSEVGPVPIPATPTSTIDWEMILVGGLIAAWLIGAAWVLLRAVVASIRFNRELQTIGAVDNPAIVDTVRLACSDLGVTTPVIKHVPDLSAPALFGLWRPTLCLPEGEDLTDTQLRMIALHEAMHLRRQDGWLAWLLTAVRAAHWCNPIAWLAVRRVESYREQACDDAVRRHTATEQHGEYAELLMRFASGNPATAKLGLIGLWFARPAQELTARIAAFNSGGNSRRLPWFLSVALVAVLALVGLTDSVGGSNDPKMASPQTSVLSLSQIGAQSFVDDHFDAFEGPPEANPIEEKTYDLTSAIANADSIAHGEDHKQWLLRYLTPFEALSSAPLVRASEDSANQITVTMPRRQHKFFANVLDEVERLGHTYQVVVETRVFPSESIESVPNIDWQDAVKFYSPQPISSSQWNDESPVEAGKPSVSVEAVSFEFAPFMVFSLDEDDMQKVVEYFKAQPQSARLYAPKITLFSGQTGTIRDQSQSPFVTSVDYIRGEFATAAQPNITVIDEGVRIDIRPKMYDDKHLDLRCRLTLSAIDGVRNVKLPGQEVTVQVPKVTRQTVSTTCRMKQGESLLIASLGEKTFYYAITPSWFADPVATDD